MRNRGDRWGITESVGLTALAAAAVRAKETGRPDGLVRDPYAERFLAAACESRDRNGISGSIPDMAPPLSNYVAVRSRFYDQFCVEAMKSGITQTVILAAGLDTRALRLRWPADSIVFEVDQAGVLEFKDRVVGDFRAESAATRKTVAADLREDWPEALRAAGFERLLPTTWLAEGLLPYLPASAGSAMFERVDELSADGSRIAIEDFHLTKDEVAEQSRRASRLFGFDAAALMYLDDEREDPISRFQKNGWRVTKTEASDLAKTHHRVLDDTSRRGFFICATRC